MKKLAVLFFVLMLALVGCSEQTATPKEEPKKEEVKEEPITETEAEPEVVEPAETEPVEETPAVDDTKTKEAAMLAILKDGMSGNAEVSFNEEAKMFVMNPTGTAFAAEIAMMIQGTKSHDDWNRLVDEASKMSETIQGELGDGYSIAWNNPVNPDNFILLIMDGVVLYDVFEAGDL
jgi:hypothetical protein